MAVAPTLAIAGGILDSLKASKLRAAENGTKVFTTPKTRVGKILGSLSGRTQAAEYQKTLGSQNPANQPMYIENAKPQVGEVPITGGFSFGGEAAKKTYFPFAVVAGIVAIFFFMRKKGRGRRR